MFEIAKHAFDLPESFVEKYHGKQPEWGPLGFFVYKRTYARTKEDGNQEEYWETCRRVVEGTFSIQRNHCKINHLLWDDKKAQRTAKKMFELMWKFSFLPPGRGLWSMGTDIVYQKGSAALNNCFQYETEIITREGIKKIGDCVNTTQTLLTEGGKWIDAPISDFGVQKLTKLTISRAGRTKEIYTTADHNWYVQDRRKTYRDEGWTQFKTKDLRPNVHRLQYCFGQGINNTNTKPSKYGIIHGLVFGDGSVHTTSNVGFIKLCGNKNTALSEYFPFISDKEEDKDGNLTIHGLPSYFKDDPELHWDRPYLYGFLSGYFAADGSCDIGGQCNIVSYKKANLELVRSIAAILGMGTYDIREETRISNLDNKSHKVYILDFMRSTLNEEFFLLNSHKNNFINNKTERKNHWTVIKVEEMDKYEHVFCASVPETHKFTLAGNILTGNCAYVSTENIEHDLSKPFCFVMDMSMLGVGCGFGTEGAGKITIKNPFQELNGSGRMIIIPDTREGWVMTLSETLDSYFRGYPTPEFDFSKIRSAGAPIKTFGGTASGPEPLMELMDDIKKLLNNNIDQTITSTIIVDIMNMIGRCVVAGNTRRSAELSLGRADDKEFSLLKQDKEKLIAYRWASNNSIVANIGMDYSWHATQTAQNGEPGYMWLDNARAYGRTKDPMNWVDRDVVGCNPCSEQSLHNYELCTLVETFPARHDSLEEYLETLKIAYLYAKTVTLVPTHWHETNSIMTKNRRIGLSQSGIIKAFGKHGRREILRWCDKGYEFINGLDIQYSNWLGIPKSIKKTSIKPSGTVSLLPGEPPGIHYPHSKYYIRRIRVGVHSPLIKIAKEAGYKLEPAVGQESSTFVVEFPIKEDYFERSKNEVSIWEQVSNAVAYQKYWADNMVSITVTFKPEEKNDIQHILELYEDSLKSISFLPLKEHGYIQAPYETITEEQYIEMTKNLKPLKYEHINENSVAPKYCDAEACTL